jgi:O-antigen/teichoic acid export membrane protein
MAPSLDAARFSRWAVNVGSGYADLLVGGAIYVLLTPILVSHLGVDGYAVWVMSHVITFYLGFLDLGVSRAQVRFHARQARRPRYVRQLIATTTAALTLAGIAAAMLAVATASLPLGEWFGVSAPLGGALATAVAILGANLLLRMPGSVLDSAYEGCQRFDLRNLRSLGLRLFTAAAQLALVWRGHGVVALVAVELASAALRIGIDLAILPRLMPGLLRVEVRLYPRVWRRIRPFALWAFIDDVLVEGSAQLDRLLIGLLLPLSMLTPYALCTTLAGLLLMAVQPVVDTFFPMAAGWQRDRSALRRLLQTGTLVVTALAAPAALFLALFGADVLRLWVPAAAELLPAAVMPVIVANFFLSAFFWTATVMIMALGHIRLVAALTGVELAAALALMLVLVPGWGLSGFVLAALGANAGVGLALLVPRACRTCGLPVGYFITRTLGRVLLALLPALVLALTLRLQAATPGPWMLALAVVAIGSAYLTAFPLLGMNGRERGWIRQQARAVLTVVLRRIGGEPGPGAAAP